jgi:hypothetical protein
MPRKESQTPTLQEVQTRFDEWRGKRQSHTPIPSELWSAAMEVARQDGVGRTAAALHLDCSKLKRLMTEAGMINETTAPSEFVELVAPSGTWAARELPECTIELEGRQGKLRIHCKGASAADLATLSRVLWDAAS